MKTSSYISIDGWKSNLRFSSAHIIPEYEKCGRIHGHTYAVHVNIYGSMDEKGIIMDFSVVKEIIREIINDLDHRILIPKNSSILKINKDQNSVCLDVFDKKYMFPVNDCVFLPIDSTSAEHLAEYILSVIIKKIDFPKRIKSVEIGVDEGYGQGARIVKDL